MRSAEMFANSITPGSGPYIYWDLLVGPATDTLFMTSLSSDISWAVFQNVVKDYLIDALSSSVGDFGAYLAASDFMAYIRPPRQRASATATAVPTSTPASSDIPAEGSILYDRPLNEWRAEDYAFGWMAPSATSLHIGVYGGNGEHVIEAWTSRNDFADISASVDVREVSQGSAAAGCISVRHDVSAGDYSFCILGNGRTWATYNYADAAGEWHTEVLLADALRSGARPPGEWNTLRIVAKGDHLWFIANGVVHGSVQHSARGSGAVAVSVTTWDIDQDAEFEFKNLIVRDVP